MATALWHRVAVRVIVSAENLNLFYMDKFPREFQQNMPYIESRSDGSHN